jgi:hypothetical protein
MLLIGSSLALLVIYAGVKLLIQVKRETLGHIYNGAAWFFIIAGFLILVCAGACCIAMCCKYGTRMMHKEYKMMGGNRGDMERYHKSHKKMMKYHHMKHSEGSVVNTNCCGTEMDKCCDYMNVCKRDSLKNRK